MVSFPYTFFFEFPFINLLWRHPNPLLLPLDITHSSWQFFSRSRRFLYWHYRICRNGSYSEIAHNLKITVPEAGHFISAYALGVVIGAPIIAILGAKVPRKTYCFASCCFMVLPMHVQL